MAKPKPSSRILARIFDRTTSPTYFINTDFAITYANESCAQWVGLELETLVSATCVFSSQDINKVQNKVQGLCPPPELMNPEILEEESPFSFTVWASKNENEKSWRHATMSQLFDSDQNQLGVLVICHALEHSSARPANQSSGTDSFDSNNLHTALAEIRSRADRIYSLETLVGTSPFATRLRRQVKTAIETNADLLVIGPTGSGKEHLSRTIHSVRSRDQPSELLPVHCSIADQKLIQQNIKDIVSSQADTDSSRGTNEQDWLLLLDVDQLGEAAQNELLGFFQLPNFPLRTIATSAVSLIGLAERGRYSTDLAHYLSVMTIELVPLAKRLADIPVLAQALIERDNHKTNRQLSGFTTGVLQQFIEFDWPENIDQLNRTIRLAARNATDSQIKEADLPDEFCHAVRALRIGSAKETSIQLDQYLAEIEKELVTRALKQAKGNKTKAAQLLGISRPKLLRRLQLFRPEIFGPTDTDDDQLDPSAFEELK